MKKPFIYAWPKTGGKAGARWRENVYQFRIALVELKPPAHSPETPTKSVFELSKSQERFPRCSFARTGTAECSRTTEEAVFLPGTPGCNFRPKQTSVCRILLRCEAYVPVCFHNTNWQWVFRRRLQRVVLELSEPRKRFHRPCFTRTSVVASCASHQNRGFRQICK